MHDIVHYARSQNILCQGRGSAANSAVCFVLGVTSVNPQEINLLFERFLSEERLEPPDIDVDFEHDRREEVMQYVYRRYGRHRAAIVATVIHYRPRSAIRDVGKALGLTEDITGALADTVWGSWGDGYTRQQLQQAGLDPNNPMIGRAIELATELIGFPRHLSQHVGGYVLTQDQLDTYVPIGNAAMEYRTFIEWDKDDVDAMRMMKVDVLALGMLTCIRKSFDLIAQHKGERYELADIKGEDDDDVYQMLQRGESLGVFQVESRAQMNMLPRLKPKHVLRSRHRGRDRPSRTDPGRHGASVSEAQERRSSRSSFPRPITAVWREERARADPGQNPRRAAVPGAGDADRHRGGKIHRPTRPTSCARRWRRSATTAPSTSSKTRWCNKLIERGYPEEFARNCFNQIKGFGEYGFPESHAASFAKLVYVSSWLKHLHPDVFCCALLNSQPMGFYAPAQIVARRAQERRRGARDRRLLQLCRQHAGRAVRRSIMALRLGFRQIDGFAYVDPDDYIEPDKKDEETRKRAANDWSKRIVEARKLRPFSSLEDFARATALPKRALILLADADAFRSLGLDRRAALWAVRRLPDDIPLPLFTAALAREQPDESGTSRCRRCRCLSMWSPTTRPFACRSKDIRWSSCGECLRRKGSDHAAMRPRSPTADTPVAPAWCWCGSGRARPRARSS